MTTIRDLADELAERHGIDRDAARASVREVADQGLADDPTLYDPETGTLSPSGAELVREQFAAHYAGTDTQSESLLHDIARARDAVSAAQERFDRAVAERDELIRRAISRGVRIVDIADAAGLHPQRIYQIRDGRR